MLGRNLGEKPSHERSQPASEQCYQASAFRDTHQAQPERHNTNEGESRVQNGKFSHFEALIRDRFEVAGAASDNDGQQNEPKPDIIEHPQRRYTLFKKSEISFNENGRTKARLSKHFQ